MCSLINKQLLLTAYAYLFIMEQQKVQQGSEALELQVEQTSKRNTSLWKEKEKKRAETRQRIKEAKLHELKLQWGSQLPKDYPEDDDLQTQIDFIALRREFDNAMQIAHRIKRQWALEILKTNKTSQEIKLLEKWAIQGLWDFFFVDKDKVFFQGLWEVDKDKVEDVGELEQAVGAFRELKGQVETACANKNFEFTRGNEEGEKAWVDRVLGDEKFSTALRNLEKKCKFCSVDQPVANPKCVLCGGFVFELAIFRPGWQSPLRREQQALDRKEVYDLLRSDKGAISVDKWVDGGFKTKSGVLEMNFAMRGDRIVGMPCPQNIGKRGANPDIEKLYRQFCDKGKNDGFLHSTGNNTVLIIPCGGEGKRAVEFLQSDGKARDLMKAIQAISKAAAQLPQDQEGQAVPNGMAYTEQRHNFTHPKIVVSENQIGAFFDNLSKGLCQKFVSKGRTVGRAGELGDPLTRYFMPFQYCDFIQQQGSPCNILEDPVGKVEPQTALESEQLQLQLEQERRLQLQLERQLPGATALSEKSAELAAEIWANANRIASIKQSLLKIEAEHASETLQEQPMSWSECGNDKVLLDDLWADLTFEKLGFVVQADVIENFGEHATGLKREKLEEVLKDSKVGQEDIHKILAGLFGAPRRKSVAARGKK